MVEGREERREQRRERAVVQFGADAESALGAFDLLDAAWHGTYGEPTPPTYVMDDIWSVAQDIPHLVSACWQAYLDPRDLRLWADSVRANADNRLAAVRPARSRRMQIRIRRVGERRVLPFFQLRPDYEIVILDGARTVYHARTVNPSGVLVGKGKVHTSDWRDWVNAADYRFSPYSESWVDVSWPLA